MITRPADGVELFATGVGYPSVRVGATDDVGFCKDLISYSGGCGSHWRQIQNRERVSCDRTPMTTKGMVTITVPLGYAALREHPLCGGVIPLHVSPHRLCAGIDESP